MQVKGRWGLVETNLKAHLGPVDYWWSKSYRGSSGVAMDKRLKVTCMQCHLEEKRWSRTCQKAGTIAIRTANWRICEGRLGS